MDRHPMTDNGAVLDAGADKAGPVSAQHVIAPAVCAVCPQCGEDVLHYCGESAKEIERLRDPSVKCGRGHSPGLPLMLWDCPACTENLRAELEREKAAADTVRRSNAGMLEEIDRWREDAGRLASRLGVHVSETLVEPGVCQAGCQCPDHAALAAHEALAKEASN